MLKIPVAQGVPLPPSDAGIGNSIDLDALWDVLTSGGVGLTDIEADVVLRKIGTAASQREEDGGGSRNEA